MMDFNSQSAMANHLSTLVDAGLQTARAQETARSYLGASRVGVSCERALQYEYAHAPIDPERGLEGRLLRIFERGHVIERCMASWLQQAGFDLHTQRPDGEPFGFATANGRLRGHVDGVILDGPLGYGYPALWENKCLGTKSWRALKKRRLAFAKPVYAAQVALYQAYLGLHQEPAIFTAVNADTMEIYTELVPFNGALAQRMSDRAVKVIAATEAGELLPRTFSDPTHIECRFCPWQSRCWKSPT